MLKKSDLIDRLAAKGYTKKDSAVIIDDFVAVITEALTEGESVLLYGFGEFSVREHAARESVDVLTQERITIPAYKAPVFTAGKLLKRAIKEGFLRK